MKPMLPTLFAACMLSGCAIAISPDVRTHVTTRQEWNGPSFKRMTILVGDLDRSVRLWRDILKFEVTVNPSGGANSYSYPVFNIDPAATLRYAMISAGPSQQRTVALAEVKGQQLVIPQSPRVAAAVLNANGRFHDILRLARAEGFAIIEPVELKSAQGVGIEGAFVDWDGHLIVIYEFPKAADAK